MQISWAFPSMLAFLPKDKCNMIACISWPGCLSGLRIMTALKVVWFLWDLTLKTIFMIRISLVYAWISRCMLRCSNGRRMTTWEFSLPCHVGLRKPNHIVMHIAKFLKLPGLSCQPNPDTVWRLEVKHFVECQLIWVSCPQRSFFFLSLVNF